MRDGGGERGRTIRAVVGGDDYDVLVSCEVGAIVNRMPCMAKVQPSAKYPEHDSSAAFRSWFGRRKDVDEEAVLALLGSGRVVHSHGEVAAGFRIYGTPIRDCMDTARYVGGRDLQENCCTQDGPLFFVWSGFDHGFTFCAGAKRLGGAAKGMPRNWETVVEASGRCVGIPTMTPASIVAVGNNEEALATLQNNERVAAIEASVCGEYIVAGVMSGEA
jgi:hypothetical protein